VGIALSARAVRLLPNLEEETMRHALGALVCAFFLLSCATATREQALVSRAADAMVGPEALRSVKDPFRKRHGELNNVLYGSDYPHTIGDMAGCLSRVDALPDLTREKVRGWNAQRIIKL
jgi:hypothetical protein